MHCECRLIGQRLGKFDFFGTEETLLSEAQAYGSFEPSLNEHGNQEDGDDAQWQQAVPQCKRRYRADVFNHTELACAKNFGPGPKIFHRQPKIHSGKPGISFGNNTPVFEREFKTDHARRLVSPPNTAAVRSQIAP